MEEPYLVTAGIQWISKSCLLLSSKGITTNVQYPCYKIGVVWQQLTRSMLCHAAEISSHSYATEISLHSYNSMQTISQASLAPGHGSYSLLIATADNIIC